jgi:hypothetical protein
VPVPSRRILLPGVTRRTPTHSVAEHASRILLNGLTLRHRVLSYLPGPAGFWGAPGGWSERARIEAVDGQHVAVRRACSRAGQIVLTTSQVAVYSRHEGSTRVLMTLRATFDCRSDVCLSFLPGRERLGLLARRVVAQAQVVAEPQHHARRGAGAAARARRRHLGSGFEGCEAGE